MLGLLFGSLFRSALAGPACMMGLVLSIIAFCGCMKLTKCRLRDCSCLKRIFRFTGQDNFDDFDLLILVHDVTFDSKEAKMATVVRVTAGSHTVKTDPNSNGIFQQPLNIHIEQGTEAVVLELLDMNRRVLASLAFEPSKDIVQKNLKPEMTYNMKTKAKGITNTKLKLTMVVDSEEEAERGLLANTCMNPNVDFLVRQQIIKAKEKSKDEGQTGASDTELLVRAGSGPLEIFEKLGKTTSVYVAVLGPPISRRWTLAIWADFHDYQADKRPVQEVDLLRVEGVQGDPSRHHVFMIIYFDDARTRQTLTFRRTDRPRDVWVEILHLLVTQAREAKQNERSKKVANSQKPDKRKTQAGRKTELTGRGSKVQRPTDYSY